MWHQYLVRYLQIGLLSAAALLPVTVQASGPARICVFDPAGRGGELFDLAGKYLKDAGPLELRPYVDERIAAEDFKAGQCDGVVISTFRAKQFNSFVGSIDAFGGVPATPALKPLFEVLNKPAFAADMVQGHYEVAGLLPLGSLYVLVRDRRINAVEKAAGRRVAVLSWDRSQAQLVQSLAAQPVAADITSYSTRFNNGQVDIIAAPALLFRQFEVEKGLSRGGAVYRFPLAQLTATVLLRPERFPAGFAASLRQRAPAFVDTSLATIKAAEAALPAQYWLDLGDAERQHYQQLLASARDQLTQEGFYDPRMMALLHKLRCRADPAGSECVLGLR